MVWGLLGGGWGEVAGRGGAGRGGAGRGGAYRYINSNSLRNSDVDNFIFSISNRPCKKCEPTVQLLLSRSCAWKQHGFYDVNVIVIIALYQRQNLGWKHMYISRWCTATWLRSPGDPRTIRNPRKINKWFFSVRCHYTSTFFFFCLTAAPTRNRNQTHTHPIWTCNLLS